MLQAESRLKCIHDSIGARVSPLSSGEISGSWSGVSAGNLLWAGHFDIRDKVPDGRTGGGLAAQLTLASTDPHA
jgi:hypothetical protein